MDTRQRLIQAATDAFREEGYRVSVDRIAAKAGVAKQTLYNYFPSKADLFAVVACRATEAILISLDGETGDIRESLLRFSTAFRVKLLGDEGLEMFRALIGEISHFPDLAKAFFEGGPAQMASRLADLIARAMNNGALRQDDPQFAAEMLLSMLGGIERIHRLCGQPALSAEQETLRVARIVDCFLMAFAPQRTSS